VAVSSKVQGADGKWRALDARVLYAMKVAASEAYNTAFEARLSASLGVTFTARPGAAGGREPVREITGVPHSMIEFFSRRRAAIEARYTELLRAYRGTHGHDPDPAAGYQLAWRANLDTRQGKKPSRSLADKRAAWREELTAAFGPGAVTQLMKAVPFDNDPRVDQVRRDPRQYAGREVLLNVLATEGAPLSATETITSAQDEAASLATLVPRYLHAARQDAGTRYQAAAIRVLGEDGGNSLAADPAWSAVVRRLFDAEGDGWEPARLLATVAFKRELASADSTAEVLAWRIDAFLDDCRGFPQPVDMPGKPTLPDGGPVHESGCRAYESSAGARERLTALAVTTLSGPLADRAQAEAAWPALIAALRRAENAGYSPADALTRTATARELHTARSVSELLAWRINRHLAAHPADTNNPAITANELTATPSPEMDDNIPPGEGNGYEQNGRSTAAGPGTAPLGTRTAPGAVRRTGLPAERVPQRRR
jgi:hypothetical protein